MSSESATAWSTVAEGWERRDAWLSTGARPITEQLLGALDPRPGDAVLDIGCGTGEVGLRVAERVGPDGRVLLTDQSPGMIEVAGRRSDGLGNVELSVMDAQALDLDDASIDRAVSRFAFMLMDDPALALAETRRVVRAGGRLAFAVWTSGAENTWGSTAGRTLVELGLAEPPEPDAPGPFRLADPERLRALVVGAGFGEPELEPVAISMRYASLDEYWEVTKDLSMSFRDALARLSDADAAELRSRVEVAFAPHMGPAGLAIPGRAWVVAADAA